MTLPPNGRLPHLESIEDTTAMALGNVAALAARVSDGGIDLFVAEGSEPGLTQLRVEPGALAPILTAARWRRRAGGGALTGDARGDLLMGGAGADTLDGGGGADILIDGAGSDALRGGAGADVFILHSDGAPDRIMDFQLGVDRLDLSAWGRIYGQGQLTFESLAGGVEIRHGTERLLVLSSDGAAIAPASFTNADILDLWHVGPAIVPPPPPPPPPPGPPMTLLGTAGADTLTGRGADDLIVGRGGADRLSGGAGSDRLLGDDRSAAHDAVAAQVYRLYETALDREPDAATHAAWTRALQARSTTLAKAAASLAASAEFRADHGTTSNEAFVRILYDNVLDRAPSAAALASWTNALDRRRVTRAQVLTTLMQDAEFVARRAEEIGEAMRDGGRDDRLEGGAGHNILFGGVGADTFVFTKADGGTRLVAGLETWDRIELAGFDIADGGTVLTLLEQVGRDVVIDHEGLRVTLVDNRLAEVTADMFVF